MTLKAAGPDGLSFARGTTSLAVALVDGKTNGSSELSDVQVFGRRMEGCSPGAVERHTLKNGWPSAWMELRCSDAEGGAFPASVGAASVEGRRYLFVGVGATLPETRAFAESARQLPPFRRDAPLAYDDGPWPIQYVLGNTRYRYSLPPGGKSFPSRRTEEWVGLRDKETDWNFCEYYDQGLQQVMIPLRGDGLSFLSIEHRTGNGDSHSSEAYIKAMDEAFPGGRREAVVERWNGFPAREAAWKGPVRGTPSVFVDYLVEDREGYLRIGLQTPETEFEENSAYHRKLKRSVARPARAGGKEADDKALGASLLVFAALTLLVGAAPFLLAAAAVAIPVALGFGGLRAAMASRRDGVTRKRLDWVAAATVAEAAAVAISGPGSLLGLLCIGLGLIQAVFLSFAFRKARAPTTLAGRTSVPPGGGL
jgi:hypothetical protein